MLNFHRDRVGLSIQSLSARWHKLKTSEDLVLYVMTHAYESLHNLVLYVMTHRETISCTHWNRNDFKYEKCYQRLCSISNVHNIQMVINVHRRTFKDYKDVGILTRSQMTFLHSTSQHHDEILEMIWKRRIGRALRLPYCQTS